MAVIDEIVSDYHSLEGYTIKEKRKSFNKLVEKIKTNVTHNEEVNKLILSLIPTNKLEEILKVELLIELKRNDELLQILKGGNTLLIAKVLKHWRFFQEVFPNIDENTLINDIFPYTSFTTRMKIINKLSSTLKDENQVNSYFRAIEKKYGLKIACAILPACSIDLIKQMVETYKLNLSCNHVLRIVKKHKDFLIFYYDLLFKKNKKKYEFINKYTSALKYIAKVDKDLYWMLHDSYDLKIKFGRHMTANILENKKEFMKNPNNLRLFNSREVFKIMKRENYLKPLFLSFYPETTELFFPQCIYKYSEINRYLKFMPKSKQYEILNGYYREKYGTNLHDADCEKYISEDYLKLVPEQEREKLLHEKCKDETFIYMYNTKKSVPMIKDRIKHTSDISKRKQLIGQLLQTCTFHNDSETLLQIFKYILVRHKNDGFILVDFIRSLSNWHNMEKLTGEHWSCINDLLKVLNISGNKSYKEQIYKENYLIYLTENNLPFDEEMKNYLKYVKDELYYIKVYRENLKYRKFCLEHFGLLIPQMFEGKDYEDMSSRFLTAIMNHNETNSVEHEIPILNYKDMMNVVKTRIEKDGDAQCIIKYCVKSFYGKVDEFDRFFWENYKQLRDDDMLIWYLETDPRKVSENIEKILIHNLDYRLDAILKLMSLLSYQNIPQQVINFALTTLHNEDYKNTNFAVKALSYLGTEQQYFDAIKPFYPSEDGRIDLEESSEKVALQQTIVKNLMNLRNPSVTLEVLGKFCIADFLKYALAPLYSIVNKTMEIKLSEFLNVLYKSAVSVRKHAVYLTCTVSSKDVIYNFLKQLGTTEKNASLQKAVLRKTLKYFTENPSEEFWNLLKMNVNIIDKDDREAHDALINLSEIPVECLPNYIILIYEKLTNSKDKEIYEKKYKLIKCIPTEVMNSLSTEFLMQIITETLFKPKIELSLSFFCFNCIFHTSDEKQMQLLDFTLNILKTFVEKNWSELVTGATSNMCSNFLREFCKNVIESNCGVLVYRFASFWTTIFNPEDIIEEHMLLEFLVIFMSCASENKLSEFGSKANQMLMRLIEKYDVSIINIFSDQLETFIYDYLKISKITEQREIIISFFNSNECPHTYVAILNLLMQQILSVSNAGPQLAPLFEKIQKCKVPIVQLHFKRCLKQKG